MVRINRTGKDELDIGNANLNVGNNKLITGEDKVRKVEVNI